MLNRANWQPNNYSVAISTSRQIYLVAKYPLGQKELIPRGKISCFFLQENRFILRGICICDTELSKATGFAWYYHARKIHTLFQRKLTTVGKMCFLFALPKISEVFSAPPSANTASSFFFVFLYFFLVLPFFFF